MQQTAMTAAPSARPNIQLTQLAEHNSDAPGRAPWKAWTGKERVFVRDNYQAKGAPWVAKQLGRSAASVRTFAITNGFGRKIDEVRIQSTPSIDDYLRRVHASSPKPGYARTCSKAIGRPIAWVRQRAAELGIVRRPTPAAPWTPEEKSFVMMHQHRTRAYLSNMMRAKGWKRSPAAIHHFIQYHRLADDGRYQGPEALSLCLGVSTTAIRAWANTGLLIARDRNCRKPGDPEPLRRIFDEADVARFIVENPTKIDMRKVDGPWLIDLLARLGSRGLLADADKSDRIAALHEEDPKRTYAQIAAMVDSTPGAVGTVLSRRRGLQRAAQAA